MKYVWINEHRGQFSVNRMCRQLEVSRSGYCQWGGRAPSDRSGANAGLDAQVAAIHAESNRSYGRPRIVQALSDQGIPVSHERVRNSLKRQGLRPVYKRPFRVTTDEGWLYLACIMDLASRRIVGWSMNERIKADLVCEALKSAYWRRKPPEGLIMHSDRGSQYASNQHRRLIQDYGMIQSMSRRANCWDNAVMESFFKTLKVERIYGLRYETRAQAKLDIVNWIEGFYNQRRIHSSIGYKTPACAEASLMIA